MRQRIQRMLTAVAGLLLLLSSSGCGFSFSPTDLYSLPQLPEDDCQVDFGAMCSEDGGECRAVISWPGEAFDPVRQGDEISIKLALSRTRDHSYEYADGKNVVKVLF